MIRLPITKKLSVKVSVISLILTVLLVLCYFFALGSYVNKDNPRPNWMEHLPVTLSPLSFSLEVNSPDDNNLVFDKSIFISGKASPGSIVILSTDNSDTTLDVSNTGEFSRSFDLNPGLNHLTISSFDYQGHGKRVARQVYYSEDKI